MLKARDVLLYFSLKYIGDWDKIYSAIRNKEKFDENEYILLKSEVKSNYITMLDDEYPESLKNIHKPPFVIYYYGDINLLKNDKLITIVGSRDYSEYGEYCCVSITKELVTKGYVVVSGLARGIDVIAHNVALENEGKTIAILGSGIDYCYPKQNSKTYEQIKEKGLLMSEYPNNFTAIKENFPKRNRILAGLSPNLFAPEFKINSGTSITISLALSYGKNIFCPPHPISSMTGNNILIKEGAMLVETANDIIFEIEGKNMSNQ
ncbi:MAG: DNA-processing protein DprA [Erysipelotrichaceae bacterium]|nr:DNA-processing protein DprA [Erysipelotrichaceae bacterium]